MSSFGRVVQETMPIDGYEDNVVVVGVNVVDNAHVHQKIMTIVARLDG